MIKTPPFVPITPDGELHEIEIDRDGLCQTNYCTWITCTCGLCALFPICFWSRALARRHQAYFDDHNIYIEGGYCCRSHKVIPLDRLQDVSVQQSIFEKCFGKWNLNVQTAGSPADETVNCCKDARQVRDTIMRRRDAIVLNGPAASKMIGGLALKKTALGPTMDGEADPVGRQHQMVIENVHTNEEAVAEFGGIVAAAIRLQRRTKAVLENLNPAA
ncbi:hypothetical protein HDU96_004772 [Phlyctochytrium bullatum]|nr:hypothetical protein HDU96_004772 [Phlyctochytrium bullatum]